MIEAEYTHPLHRMQQLKLGFCSVIKPLFTMDSISAIGSQTLFSASEAVVIFNQIKFFQLHSGINYEGN